MLPCRGHHRIMTDSERSEEHFELFVVCPSWCGTHSLLDCCCCGDTPLQQRGLEHPSPQSFGRHIENEKVKGGGCCLSASLCRRKNALRSNGEVIFFQASSRNKTKKISYIKKINCLDTGIYNTDGSVVL